MEAVAKELVNIIEIFRSEYLNLDDSLAELRISEDKWTLKEIIGHLIDSASNNHQRFVRLQLSDGLEFPDYKNTEWLQVHNYNAMKFNDLLSLFFYYNKLMAGIISNIDTNSRENRWNISWDQKSPYITLGELAEHYVEHIKIHSTHFKDRLIEVKNVKGGL